MIRNNEKKNQKNKEVDNRNNKKGDPEIIYFIGYDSRHHTGRKLIMYCASTDKILNIKS